ncbi:lactonase family protein [Caballeronia sp. BCC1704]|uniref:lactonase family protein n=1 Tax=Caballeronia sp. BCC1704 TaxID=2676300 RepID=UPI00158A893C|nr:lactonase family protein [Caballeronia sp. BCC1704]
MRQPEHALVFVGSLNCAVPHFAAAHGCGITTLAIDERTGKLEPLAEVGGMDNPTYLAISPARKILYATSEVFGAPEGSIAAYSFDDATGAMTPLGERRPTRGSLTAYCSTDREGRHVFVANYAHETPEELPGRHVVSLPVRADGSLLEAAEEFAHRGAGPHADRQGVPHAHCIAVSPDNRFALVTDLGADTVSTYRIDADGSGLLPPFIEPLRVSPGSGPRHLVFHPQLARVYLVNELNNTLCRLDYDVANGALKVGQVIDALPADCAPSHAADIAVSRDGRWLYASFRGADCIGVYALGTDGDITGRRQLHTSGGKTPRSFALSPANRYLLVANQDSDRLVVWKLDGETGCIVEKADECDIGTPMCVKTHA